MNIQAFDVLLTLKKSGFQNQRELAKQCRFSLGATNAAIKTLTEEKYIDDSIKLTKKAEELLSRSKPEKAILLAAGMGMRMAPLNTEMPKALLEVHGQPLIERLICQLQEVGIKEIYVVVGFMKERFEYLIERFGVSLIVNTEYALRNNLHSLSLAKDHLENAYIVPCDLWCKENPFNENELYPWYTVSDELIPKGAVRVNRKSELVVAAKENGNKMLGIAYLTSEAAKKVCKNILNMDLLSNFNSAFWEEALYNGKKLMTLARVVSQDNIVEINTYEQLRELDAGSANLKSDAILTICKVLNVEENDIRDISALKKGMTNRSFFFSCLGEKYIMRIPGEGTDMLINRKNEAAVYNVIADKNLCDDIVYINPENGYKITRFIEGVRPCDCEDKNDVSKCMKKLRSFHEMRLSVKHEFNLFEMINFYESLWNGIPSDYKDYEQTKKNVFSLKNYIEDNVQCKCLTHIDAVPDNFLFVEKSDGSQELKLIDWEYSSTQDPHVDIAMFCIYSMYNRKQIDALIDAYFVEGCPENIRIKIYCYISVCGLLWSNWCEYKRILGVEFGEYSLQQYRFAKEYYKIASELIAATED